MGVRSSIRPNERKGLYCITRDAGALRPQGAVEGLGASELVLGLLMLFVCIGGFNRIWLGRSALGWTHATWPAIFGMVAESTHRSQLSAPIATKLRMVIDVGFFSIHTEFWVF